MATTYKSPGVYVQEIQKLPASIAQVETAVPAFIGYTGTAPEDVSARKEKGSVRIESLLDFEEQFGGPPVENISITVDSSYTIVGAEIEKVSPYKMYHALRMFYANGGGPCHIISIGDYTGRVSKADFLEGLEILEKEDEPTLILFPDAGALESDIYQVYTQALAQCNKLQDRFALLDIAFTDDSKKVDALVEEFRNGMGTRNLKYGAAYYPWLNTSLNYHYTDASVKFKDASNKDLKKSLKDLKEQALIPGNSTPGEKDAAANTKVGTLAKAFNNAFEENIREAIDQLRVTISPSSAVAGVYAVVDRERGVWKAPANVSLNAIIGPALKITNDMQDRMNVDPTAGKSINAIRTFFGKGTLVWGARTMAGNDNEWRYINVRRFFNMVEESVKKSIDWAVFEPNEPNTWVRVIAMIENYLTGLWRQGALVGSTTDQAFFVNVGLGTTMTSQDILEGRMNVEIGLATSRPAEFIILKFSHKLQEA